MLVEKTEIGFCIERYRTYDELPLEDVDALPFCVYIIDYNWTYLFINKAAERVFGEKVQNLAGQNALQVFQHEQFKSIFKSIEKGVRNKVPCDETIYSPLRGKQVKVKGYPLCDCYYFYSVTLPAKEELLDELRQELNKRKDAF